jgi:hypothetical protein
MEGKKEVMGSTNQQKQQQQSTKNINTAEKEEGTKEQTCTGKNGGIIKENNENPSFFPLKPLHSPIKNVMYSTHIINLAAVTI